MEYAVFSLHIFLKLPFALTGLFIFQIIQNGEIEKEFHAIFDKPNINRCIPNKKDKINFRDKKIEKIEYVGLRKTGNITINDYDIILIKKENEKFSFEFYRTDGPDEVRKSMMTTELMESLFIHYNNDLFAHF